MIEILINDIEQAMLNTLNNEQLSQLRKVLEYTFRNVRVTENEQSNAKESNSELVTSFISSKSVEGCSENTIAYYRSTINNALTKIDKKISHVTTDDLRNYLNNYQKESGVEIRLRNLGRQLNIPKVHPHKFRRTLATMAIDKGMPIEQVQHLLGHQSLDTTLQYAMVNQNNVKLSHRKYLG